jgi:hypothetical protein
MQFGFASREILVAVIGRALAVLIFFVGLAFWAIGGWQVYESNTVFGAVLVLAGGFS